MDIYEAINESLETIRLNIQEYYDIDSDQSKHEGKAKWNLMCNGIDILEDSFSAIEGFLINDITGGLRVGEKMLRIYGVLQCVIVNQDAARHMSQIFGVPFELGKNNAAQKVRDFRNQMVGHPTESTIKGQPVKRRSCISPSTKTSKHASVYTYYEFTKEKELKDDFDPVNMHQMIADYLPPFHQQLKQIIKQRVELIKTSQQHT